MIDFAGVWNETIKANVSARHLEAVDRAFWNKKAEANAVWTRQTPETLAALRGLLRKNDTLLDVGAGTGRFALQLAPWVSQVTALDYSAAMLAQLEQKKAQLGVTNVETRLGHLLNTDLDPHSVVLAAWSLYSSGDILATLERLLSLSTRQLIIVDDDSSGSPHRQLREQLWAPRPRPMPKYLVLTGALWQLGVRADIHIVRETNRTLFTDAEALLADFCPEDADAETKAVLLEKMQPYLNQTENGLEYRYPFEVALVHRRSGGSPVRFC